MLSLFQHIQKTPAAFQSLSGFGICEICWRYSKSRATCHMHFGWPNVNQYSNSPLNSDFEYRYAGRDRSLIRQGNPSIFKRPESLMSRRMIKVDIFLAWPWTSQQDCSHSGWAISIIELWRPGGNVCDVLCIHDIHEKVCTPERFLHKSQSPVAGIYRFLVQVCVSCFHDTILNPGFRFSSHFPC